MDAEDRRKLPGDSDQGSKYLITVQWVLYRNAKFCFKKGKKLRTIIFWPKRNCLNEARQTVHLWFWEEFLNHEERTERVESSGSHILYPQGLKTSFLNWYKLKRVDQTDVGKKVEVSRLKSPEEGLVLPVDRFFFSCLGNWLKHFSLRQENLQPLASCKKKNQYFHLTSSGLVPLRGRLLRVMMLRSFPRSNFRMQRSFSRTWTKHFRQFKMVFKQPFPKPLKCCGQILSLIIFCGPPRSLPTTPINTRDKD